MPAWRTAPFADVGREEVGINVLTAVAAALIIHGLLGKRGFGRPLALAGATPAGAALVLGNGLAVPTFYAVAIGALAALVLRLLRSSRSGTSDGLPPVPASRQLILLVVTCVLVTLLAPVFFSGLVTDNPTGGALVLTPGIMTKSNIAQAVYLILSLGVIAHLARSTGTGPQVVGLTTCLATVLSFWAWLHQSAALPFPEGVFDNSPAFQFQETLPGGAARVRGIFSEPAALATSCLVTTAYCSSRFAQVRGLHRLGLLAVASAALFLGSISTSTTFLVAGVVIVAIAAAVGVMRFVLRGAALARPAVALLCALAVAALFSLPYFANYLGQQFADKVSSASYQDRSGADTHAFQLVADTYGFGTGLGSNRASSFVSTLLSTVGVVGTLLLVAAIARLISRGWRLTSARPAVWALIALLACKIVSGPDLSDSSGVLWLSLGVLAHASLRADLPRRAVPYGDAFPVPARAHRVPPDHAEGAPEASR